MTPGMRNAVYVCVSGVIEENMSLLETISSCIQEQYDALSLDTHSEYLTLNDIIIKLDRVVKDLDMQASSEEI